MKRCKYCGQSFRAAEAAAHRSKCPAMAVKCGWCDQPFTGSMKDHQDRCVVRAAVRDAERNARRPLTFEETKDVRDRARASIGAN